MKSFWDKNCNKRVIKDYDLKTTKIYFLENKNLQF